MDHPRHHIFEFTPDTLAEWCVQRGMPRFRAKQILEWVYERGVIDPGAMSNLSKLDRDVLTVSPESLKATQVLWTMFEGKKVYEAER